MVNLRTKFDRTGVDGMKFWNYSADYPPTNWTPVNPNNPDIGDCVAADLDGDSEEEVFVDITGKAYVYDYSSSPQWFPINPNNIYDARARRDENGKCDLVVDFSSPPGLWVCTPDVLPGIPLWQPINPNEAEWNAGFVEPYRTWGGVWGSLEFLAVDFGPLGLWQYRHYVSTIHPEPWSQLNPNNPEFMVSADLNGDSDDELVVDFGPGIGLLIYDEEATKKWNPINLNSADGPGN